MVATIKVPTLVYIITMYPHQRSVLLVSSTLPQPVKKFSAFYENYFYSSQLFSSILSQFNSFHALKSFNTHFECYSAIYA